MSLSSWLFSLFSKRSVTNVSMFLERLLFACNSRMVKHQTLETKAWNPILAPLFPGWVTLGKLPTISVEGFIICNSG